jgi:membrane associated rhomboid family serine protease
MARFFLLLCWLGVGVWAEDEQTNTVGGCDDDSISDSVPLSKLTPNQFHKICPSQRSGELGQPICGDGTNFGFFVTKPIQRKANDQKILIEFMGGGACWDDETCGYNEEVTTFPEALNDFVGYSCSEVAYSVQNLGGYPISMLCDQSIGDTDFTEYNTIVVPYCTQDIHLGDQTITYDEGLTMNHRGGHNTMGVLRWIFKNFGNPSHIFLTGCSAGGTVVPIAYDLIRKHYNRIGRRTVQISTIADSPVYLTPSYFLENAFGNWNPGTVLTKTGFNFNKWRYEPDYPTLVWDHILKRGSNKDKWGFVSHTYDPTSLIYYQWMSGQGEDYEGRRRLADDDGNGMQSQWYDELTTSLSTIQNKHKNVARYSIESEEGHCSFGLYYPLQEDGFEDWASQILQEQKVGHNTPAASLFFLSAAVGALVFAGAFYSSRRKREIEVDDGGFLDHEDTTKKKPKKASYHLITGFCASFTSSFTTFPITASYALAVTIYFWTMIISQGFTHPLNNPSLGPSAISLSGFGINNPSLIVYQSQVFRLVTSTFLCSGILTYLIVLLCLWFFARRLEQMLHNHVQFGSIVLLLTFGTNLFYALVANGASCSSVALVIGLNTIYIILRSRLEDSSIVGITVATIFLQLLVFFAFPFNSWIMLLSAVAVGALVAMLVITIASKEPSMMQEDGLENPNVHVNPVKLSVKATMGFGGVLFLMFCMLLFRVRRPNQLYLEPYYTGCNVMYVAGDDVSTLVSDYGSSFRRRLEDDNADDLCAQFCIPHVASQATVYGANRIMSLPLTRGQCGDIGYEEHMADKTFQVSGYSLDFEIFNMVENEDNQDDEER